MYRAIKKERCAMKIPAFAAAALAMAMASAAWAEEPATVYKSKCLPCHGAEGKGSVVAPALAGSEFVEKGPEAEVVQVIMKGRTAAEKRYKEFPSPMPPQAITEEQAKEMVKYLKSLPGKQ